MSIGLKYYSSQIYLVKESAETKFDIDFRKKLYANVELQKDWYDYVVLTGGTAGPDRLPEHLGD